MEVNKKIFGIVALAVIIIFGMAACVLIADDDDKGKDGPTHYGETLAFSKEDVWMHNRKTTKLSEVYYRFLERGEIGVNGILPIYAFAPPYTETLNCGTIKNGILSFEVPALTTAQLLSSNDLVYYFFHEWYLLDPATYTYIEITPPVNGNVITLATTTNKLLNKERFFGTNSSISQESIRFIYVDADCTITLKPGTGNWNSEYIFALTPSVLNLKKGWNTLLWRETFDNFSGNAGISIEVKHPGSIRWAIDDPR